MDLEHLLKEFEDLFLGLGWRVIAWRFLHAGGVFAFGHRERFPLPSEANVGRGAIVCRQDDRLGVQIYLIQRVHRSIHLHGLVAGGREFKIENVGITPGPSLDG